MPDSGDVIRISRAEFLELQAMIDEALHRNDELRRDFHTLYVDIFDKTR
ncbi:MAG: hypothetical protein HYY22_07805 [Thaumarchaeota archaeon]|nr:hypothetical protein [Nitrososphaerota archaeon]